MIYYEKSKNSFTKDAKIRVENTIISLCNELMQNGEIIKDKNLKTFQAIIIENATAVEKFSLLFLVLLQVLFTTRLSCDKRYLFEKIVYWIFK